MLPGSHSRPKTPSATLGDVPAVPWISPKRQLTLAESWVLALFPPPRHPAENFGTVIVTSRSLSRQCFLAVVSESCGDQSRGRHAMAGMHVSFARQIVAAEPRPRPPQRRSWYPADTLTLAKLEDFGWSRYRYPPKLARHRVRGRPCRRGRSTLRAYGIFREARKSAVLQACRDNGRSCPATPNLHSALAAIRDQLALRSATPSALPASTCRSPRSPTPRTTRPFEL